MSAARFFTWILRASVLVIMIGFVGFVWVLVIIVGYRSFDLGIEVYRNNESAVIVARNSVAVIGGYGDMRGAGKLCRGEVNAVIPALCVNSQRVAYIMAVQDIYIFL